jgi:hypothetical protein
MKRPGQGGRGRRWVLGAAVTALLTGCGAPDLLDPTEEPLAADRALLVSRITDGLEAAADQLGAGEALATRVDTACAEGTDNWKIHDSFRSICEL